MASLGSGAIRAGLDTLYFSGAHRLLQPLVGGVGMILTFHRVRPELPGSFQPNRHLEVTPQFLAEVVSTLRRHGIDIVSLDEAHRRLTGRNFTTRFAVLTFDDGYRDNLEHALPILQRYAAPFTVYVTSAFADGEGLLWWMVLEAAIAKSASVTAAVDGERRDFDCSTFAAKVATWDILNRHFNDERDEARMRAGVREIAAACGVDTLEVGRGACMRWDELIELASDRLVTIGAHTIRHPILARLHPREVQAEMEGGARRIGAMLGMRPPVHFAYPVGSPAAAGPREFTLAAEAGFKTAVTTRPGVLFPEHASVLTVLPRVSVNGEFQRSRYLDVLVSGAATAVWNRFRRVNAA